MPVMQYQTYSRSDAIKERRKLRKYHKRKGIKSEGNA